MGVLREDLHVTADPVFHLDPASPRRARELLDQAGLPEGRAFCAVSVRPWEDTGGFPQKIAALCDHLRRTHNLEILFLLMQPDRDRGISQKIRDCMEEPSFLLDIPCIPRELMAVLGMAKLCVAMRLHTLIFSARMAVPCIGLVYDPKVDSYLNELSMPSAGHVERFSQEEAIACADRLLADYGGSLARLEEKSRNLSQAARENERLLLALLEKKPAAP